MTVWRTWLPPAWKNVKRLFSLEFVENGVVFFLWGMMYFFGSNSRCQSRLAFASERETVRERLARRMWKTPWFDLIECMSYLVECDKF
jgi:hypothetical protein